MPKLKWLYSYETVKFDTPDGDLHRGQYAEFKGSYFIRNNPENNAQPTLYKTTDDRGKKIDLSDKIKDLEKVKILKEKMYYDVFEFPDGRLYRVSSLEQDYKGLSYKNASPREKLVTNDDIVDIKKDDSKWQ